MTPKMVAGFRRTFSFPNPNPSKPDKSFHVRSASLPCRSHPLIAQLKDGINELRSWESKSHTSTSAWLCDGLSRLKNVHDSFDDVLQLPQTQEALSRRTDWVEKLLEDFLCFADAYGIFQTSFISLKEDVFAAQGAVRRRDDLKIASHIKAQKKIAKEVSKLSYAVRCIGRCSIPVSISDGDAELMVILRDVIEVTVSVSVALFNGITVPFSSEKTSWISNGLKMGKRVKADEGIKEFRQVGLQSLCCMKKKGDEEVKNALKRLQDLEGAICSIEGGSERVFRSLINSRVSLLNILTQYSNKMDL